MEYIEEAGRIKKILEKTKSLVNVDMDIIYYPHGKAYEGITITYKGKGKLICTWKWAEMYSLLINKEAPKGYKTLFSTKSKEFSMRIPIHNDERRYNNYNYMNITKFEITKRGIGDLNDIKMPKL